MKAEKLRYKAPVNGEKALMNYRKGKISCCDMNKRPVQSLVMLAILLLGAFILGYLINPFYLRAGWLVMTGTLLILTGIALFLVIFKGKSSNDKFTMKNDCQNDE